MVHSRAASYGLLLLLMSALSYPEDVMDLPDVIIDFHDASDEASSETNGLVDSLPLAPAVSAPGADNLVTHSHARSLTQALSDAFLPVIRLNGQGDTATVGLRGFSDDAAGNTVIALNGVKQLSADQSPIDINHIVMDNVESMTVENGSDAVTYGDHAVGGVVSIHLKPLKDRDNLLSMQVGSFADLLTTWQWKKTKEAMTGYASMTAASTNNDRENNQYKNQQVEVGSAFDKGDHHWQWTYRDNDHHLELPGALTAEQMNTDPHQSVSDGQYVDQHISQLELQGRELLGSQWNYQTVVSGQIDRQDGVAVTAFTVNEDWLQWHQSIDRVTQWFCPIHWTLGTDWLATEYEYDSPSYEPLSHQSVMGIYSKSNWLLSPNWHVSWGGRLSHNDMHVDSSSLSVSDHEFEPAWQWALTHQLSEHDDVQLRQASSFRFPMVQEMVWTQNNEALQTQTGVSYELSYHHNTKPWDWCLSVSQLDLDNEILFVPYTDSDWFGYNENIDPTQRTIVQWDSTLRQIENLSLLSHVQWIHARLDNENAPNTSIPFVPTWRYGLGVRYHFKDHWMTQWDYAYTGQRYPMSDVSNIASPLASYGVVNGVVQYQTDRWKSGLRIDNVFNQQYPYAAVLSTNSAGDPETYYYPAPGIHFLWTMTVKTE